MHGIVEWYSFQWYCEESEVWKRNRWKRVMGSNDSAQRIPWNSIIDLSVQLHVTAIASPLTSNSNGQEESALFSN